MAVVKYQGKVYQSRDNESLLNTFLRNGINVPFSCKAGICQTCMMQILSGEVPRDSLKGLNETEVNDAKFLPCLCKDFNDLEVAPLAEAKIFSKAKIITKEYLTSDIIKLVIQPNQHFFFHGGQFINVKNYEGVIRSYSIANKHNEESRIELHIKLIENGKMSSYIDRQLEVGDSLDIQGPLGNCHYHGDKDKNLLLIGSGTGLAPLLGVIDEAFEKEHNGTISLFHSGVDEDALYYRKHLKKLTEINSNFHYHGSITGNNSIKIPQGEATDFAFGSVGELDNWIIYLCGNPQMVYKGQSLALARGGEPDAIFHDAFLSPEVDENDLATHYDEGDRYPEPNIEIWETLQEGSLLQKILSDFYDEVFQDDILASYFTDVSKHHVASKQYSFLYKALTGEDVYFGDRPRNAHHWMVITDDIFDYREELFAKILRKHKVSEDIVKFFRDLHETYRGYIVKDKPWPKIIQGITQPIDGFDHINLELDYFCTACEKELFKGEKVLYHKGSGDIYCKDCSKEQIP
ncbi:MAG: FAD-binding oxidoreductase [Gammaproteobacteria bacterium]|nr:FAD-binding oxidoreductase [Gammaproteobacteria bacterium]MDH5629037.1 FAD-binding oxidoreductase [Gammaproteobacteria bacterium]